jgi:hypothetical protein
MSCWTLTWQRYASSTLKLLDRLTYCNPASNDNSTGKKYNSCNKPATYCRESTILQAQPAVLRSIDAGSCTHLSITRQNLLPFMVAPRNLQERLHFPDTRSSASDSCSSALRTPSGAKDRQATLIETCRHHGMAHT